MRIDKFLQVSRLVKRRAAANALCDAGNVKLDGRPIRAAADVKVGQRIEINFGYRVVEAEVLEVPAKSATAKGSEMVKVLRSAKVELD